MNYFEQVDDFLANRLSEQDKAAFESQLEGDPALKEEVDFQSQVVEGVRQARTAELKAMLKNVPVNGSSFSGGKIAAGVVTVGIVATSLYFILREEPEVITPSSDPETSVIIPAQPQQDSISANQPVVIAEDNSKEESSTPQKTTGGNKAVKEKKETKPVQKPDIQVVDPTGDLSESKTDNVKSTPGRGEISTAKMEVLIAASDKKYNFHYQFTQGKLLLFGPFDKSLYEILEIHDSKLANAEGHALFLFYRENYYLLDEKQVKVTPLSMIKDPALIKLLREYRGN